MDLPPLIEGILIKRYKRFLADVDFGDHIEVTHCPNPGAMTGLKEPGSRVWCSRSDNPKRKLPYTLELIEADDTLVGINTNRPNAIAHEALINGVISAFRPYQTIQREYSWAKGTRFDFKLDDADDNSPAMLLEIKNVHLRLSDPDEPDTVAFPDSITERGTKHLQELIKAKKDGWRAALLFVVQREDSNKMVIAENIDPIYAKTLRTAYEHGVEIMAWRCNITKNAITLSNKINMVIPE
ncbi:MAG: DNA/RNA nuclease SfsA [Candidatus Puniceispirillales bacterium]